MVALLFTVGMYLFAGKEGIPPFNEGSMVAMVFLPPGTALSTTNEYMRKLEDAILQVNGVRQVSNIAGRAPADPHGVVLIQVKCRLRLNRVLKRNEIEFL